MKEKSKVGQQIGFGVFLVALSVLFYAIHYLLFHDSHHIFIYLVGDIAFVPIEVLLVTVIIHKLLEARDKRAMLRKMNMVIGAFFSEAGTELLGYFKGFEEKDVETPEILVDGDWKDEDFDKIAEALKKIDYSLDAKAGDLKGLQEFMKEKRSFLVGLLENPNLLEHDLFTNTLWAVFHLADELSHRSSVDGLPENDYKHISGDIKRAYRLLIRQWLEYLKHLKEDYPYLFSLAIRTNPFNPQASVEVK